MSFASAFKKLRRDPVAFCLDSRYPTLNKLGNRLLARERERLLALGAGAADQKITVIMTAYNTGAHLGAAIESVLAQSHENIELMIIDDASSDDTLEIAQGFMNRDSRVRVFASSVNHGTYWSKNWCLKLATSPYVAFHDSDDVSHPDRLRIQLAALIDNPARVAVTCRWRRIMEDGSPALMGGKHSRLAVISLMIKRSDAVGTIGYFDSVRIAADTEYLMRLEQVFGAKRVKNMRHVLYTGLIRGGSLTTMAGGGLLWQSATDMPSAPNLAGLQQSNRFERSLQGDRAQYHAAFLKWHREYQGDSASLTLSFPMETRPFEVPAALKTGCDHTDLGSVRELLESGDQKDN